MLHSVDPRTGVAFGPSIAETTPEELDMIVRRAQQISDEWAQTPATARAASLDAVADALEEARGQLVEIADRETALGEARLGGEVSRTAAQLRLFGSVLRGGQHTGVVISTGDNSAGTPDVRRMLWPLGPIAAFCASNFPFAFSVVGGDTASALAAGCPVVVKAHEGHPQTSELVTEIALAALHGSGAPQGVLATVYGFELGSLLVTHPGVRAAGFTGSLPAGRALAGLAAQRDEPIPFFGELGSINPVVVLPAAARGRADEIASGFVTSFTLGGGQFCTKPGIVFVPADTGLAEKIGESIRPVAPSFLLTDKIRSGFRNALANPAWQALPVLARGAAGDGHQVTAEVRTTDVPTFLLEKDALLEERFGPSSLVVGYESLDELRQALDVLPGSLTASIHADPADATEAHWTATRLRNVAGRLVMNGWPTGVAVNHAMQHGGPWPASTNSAHTSVGATAVQRWLRPVAYQNWPAELLPPELRDDNPQRVPQLRT